MDTTKARTIAGQLAKTNKPWATKASELLEACCEVVDSADGIDTGIRIVRDSEKISGQLVDGFLNDLMPAVIGALDGDRRAFDCYFGEQLESGDFATKEPTNAEEADADADADTDTDADAEADTEVIDI